METLGFREGYGRSSRMTGLLCVSLFFYCYQGEH